MYNEARGGPCVYRWDGSYDIFWATINTNVMAMSGPFSFQLHARRDMPCCQRKGGIERLPFKIEHRVGTKVE